MGPWPGLEPGLTGPQPIVLTATPPQPWKHVVDLRGTYEAFHYPMSTAHRPIGLKENRHLRHSWPEGRLPH